MLRYLRVAAHANTHNFAQRMLDAGAEEGSGPARAKASGAD